MNRRDLLQGLGAAAALALFGGRARGGPAQPGVRRLVLLMQNNGTQQGSFWPRAGAQSSPILSPLLADPALFGKTTLVRGIYVPRDANGSDANEHDMGFARMWTGAPLLSVAGHPWGGATSVDQRVATAFGAPSLTLAIHTSSIDPSPKPGFQHRRSFCYVAPGVHKLPTLDPFIAYTRLFGGSAPQTDQARRRLLLRKSALDAVWADMRELQGRLGAANRASLDAHAESLRGLETRLGDQLAGRPGPGASCERKSTAPRDWRDTAPEQLVYDERGIPDLARSHLDLIAAAFACDVTRVATLQLGYAGARWKYQWLGVDNDHHELAHQDTNDEGVDPIVTGKLQKLHRWTAEQVAYLAHKLDAIPEGDGTMLDSTLIVWANEFGRGDHSQVNIPLVMVGGSRCGLPVGGRVIDAGPQPFQRAGCTALRAMGLDVRGFGDAPECGAFAGL